MRLLYINPNSTEAMTESIVASARAALPEAEILGWTNHAGPPAIQGPEDGDAAVPGLLALLPAARQAGVEAVIIACFDDTGLDKARAAAHCPVIGIGQAAFHMAALLGGGFGVVTTLAVSVPVIAANLTSYGFSGVCGAVNASGLSVLAVEEGSPATMARLSDEIALTTASTSGPVVLGCAGMARHRAALEARTGAVLIDGVESAALLAAAMIRLRRGSSKTL